MKTKKMSAKSRQGITLTFFDEPHPKRKMPDFNLFAYVIPISATPFKKKMKTKK